MTTMEKLDLVCAQRKGFEPWLKSIGSSVEFQKEMLELFTPEAQEEMLSELVEKHKEHEQEKGIATKTAFLDELGYADVTEEALKNLKEANIELYYTVHSIMFNNPFARVYANEQQGVFTVFADRFFNDLHVTTFIEEELGKLLKKQYQPATYIMGTAGKWSEWLRW